MKVPTQGQVLTALIEAVGQRSNSQPTAESFIFRDSFYLGTPNTARSWLFMVSAALQALGRNFETIEPSLVARTEFSALQHMSLEDLARVIHEELTKVEKELRR